MRILFTACPMFGHVNTLLPLALAAQRAGHEVAVATGADFAAHVERRGLAAWAVGPTYEEAGGAPRSPADFVAAAGKRAVDLVPRAVDWAPDLVVHEESELAGLIAAVRVGTRHAVHGLGIAALGVWEAFADPVRELGRNWGMPDLVGDLRGSPYLSICPPALRPAGQPVWEQIRPLRPAFGQPAAGERLPAAVSALPRARTVHLTLGTVFPTAPGVLDAAIAGLRELFVNVVVTVGPGVDPRRLGAQPRHVLVERYLPHGLLLPRCSLVVSQGGAGILLGALANGLPQLVLPQGADQFGNAAAAQRTGAALALGPDELTADAVADAAARLMTEPGFATAARAVASEIAAMPSPDDVIGTLASGPGVAR